MGDSLPSLRRKHVMMIVGTGSTSDSWPEYRGCAMKRSIGSTHVNIGYIVCRTTHREYSNIPHPPTPARGERGSELVSKGRELIRREPGNEEVFWLRVRHRQD